MKSIRTQPTVHAAEGDERIRTAVTRYSDFARNESAPPNVCHCGQDATRKEIPDPWDGRLDGYCDDCAWARCDSTPDQCPNKRPAPSTDPAYEPKCPTCGLVRIARAALGATDTGEEQA